jgi:hypothetical protein
MAQLKPHSKDELARSSRAKGTSTLGPSHDGGPKVGFLAEAGERGLRVHHVSHGQAALVSGPDAHGGKPNIARDGKPKHVHAVPTHAGMTDAQHFCAGGGGLGHPTSTAVPGVNPINPNHTTPGKRLTPPKVAFGQKGRSPHGPINDDILQKLGQAVIAEAGRKSN